MGGDYLTQFHYDVNVQIVYFFWLKFHEDILMTTVLISFSTVVFTKGGLEPYWEIKSE